MRLLAKCIGILAIAVGIIGVISPASLIAVSYHALTPVALYVVAALRIGIGLVLIGVASGARMPKTMRVLGTVILLAGLATPFVGIDRERAMLDWWAGDGILLLRLSRCLAIAIGALIVYAVNPRHHVA
jgi:hypothetical protein